MQGMRTELVIAPDGNCSTTTQGALSDPEVFEYSSCPEPTRAVPTKITGSEGQTIGCQGPPRTKAPENEVLSRRHSTTSPFAHSPLPLVCSRLCFVPPSIRLSQPPYP